MNTIINLENVLGIALIISIILLSLLNRKVKELIPYKDRAEALNKEGINLIYLRDILNKKVENKNKEIKEKDERLEKLSKSYYEVSSNFKLFEHNTNKKFRCIHLLFAGIQGDLGKYITIGNEHFKPSLSIRQTKEKDGYVISDFSTRKNVERDIRLVHPLLNSSIDSLLLAIESAEEPTYELLIDHLERTNKVKLN